MKKQMRGSNQKYLFCNQKFTLVGAEGFEASFPSGRYAVFLVGFNSKTSLHQGLARIL